MRHQTKNCDGCKIEISVKTTSGLCRTCYARQWRKKFSNSYTEAHKRYYDQNKEKINEKRKNKRKLDPETARLYDQRSWDLHKEARLAQKREHWQTKGRELRRDKYRNDPIFRLKDRLRGRLREALQGGNYKVGSAVKDLGCSVDDLKLHLESKFQDGMSWDNYGSSCSAGMWWEIDHIIPLASFDLMTRSELLKACHYTNLQPLWEKDNKRKSARLDWKPEHETIPAGTGFSLPKDSKD